MEPIFFLFVGFVALVVVLAYRNKRGIIIAAVASLALAIPVLFVFRVMYPPDCVTRDYATAKQVAAGELCSKMQMRLHDRN